MKLLAAFDKFKESMTAEQACAIAASTAQDTLGPDCQIETVPLTDGGEGFCPILTNAASGRIERHVVTGPLGTTLESPLGWVSFDELPGPALQYFGNASGQLAVIEMASVAGLQQVPTTERNPRHTTTRGVGELMLLAAEKGAGAILLGIGGSATSDLGLGALEALGIQFPQTEMITPHKWSEVEAITGFIKRPLPPIFIACDVDNPLLGARGAAAIYGPQKGLPKEAIEDFDKQSSHLSSLLCQHFGQDLSLRDIPGSGAAGGIGFGLKAACGAEFISGFDLVQSWLDLEMQVAISDLILTGEGCFDQSSLSGKGPYALLELAEKSGTPVCILPGSVGTGTLARLQVRYPGTQVFPISPAGCSLEEALLNGPSNLARSVDHALKKLQSG
ncbi:MAG: glycerate kinase [Coraliomargarita sp. TMED73]|nr:MAG: glycerate kinase [Coraliomargarita sp. TMED73]